MLPDLTTFQINQKMTKEDTDYMVNKTVEFLAIKESLPYTAEADCLAKLNSILDGVSVVSKFISMTTYQLNAVKTQLKRQESITVLEEYPQYCQTNGLKPTMAQAEKFIWTSDKMVALKDWEAKIIALHQWLIDSKNILIMCHDDLKKATWNRNLEPQYLA